MNLDEMYNLVRVEFKKLSEIYEGALIELVGQRGLDQLLEAGLLKDVGLIHGGQMYVLIKK